MVVLSLYHPKTLYMEAVVTGKHSVYKQSYWQHNTTCWLV